MRGRWHCVLVTCLLLLLSQALVGQYGPKDGDGLPAADLERIQAGAAAPDFTLPAAEGDPVTLSGLRGKNVVMVFYRGYW